MKGVRVFFVLVFVLAFFVGCAYFQTPDKPPPLPPIEETKPPLTMKGDYFKAFPWDELPKPLKDGNDPDTTLYTVKEGDTIDGIAEKTMGEAKLGPGLASYNQLPSANKLEPGQKIVIPNPIIGLSSQLVVKSAGEKTFSEPKRFNTELKKGDQYRLRFEPNVNGHLYVFREGPKGIVMLFPAPAKKPAPAQRGRRLRQPVPAPAVSQQSDVRAHEEVLIPAGKDGFAFDQKRAGDRVYVYFSMRPIPELEALESKPKITLGDLEGVKRDVKLGEIYSEEQPYSLLRVGNPAEVLTLSLNLSG